MSAHSNKLHLGCGKIILPDHINLDYRAGEGVDVVADLDACSEAPLPIASDSIDEILGSHLIEHLRNPLPLMQELHRVARNGCKATFITPYGSSDLAFEDPTHVRPYFIHSYDYFAQPMYHRADYGYRGDWQARVITLVVSAQRFGDKAPEAIFNDVMALRNVVLEMKAELVAVKPIRPPNADLKEKVSISFVLV